VNEQKGNTCKLKQQNYQPSLHADSSTALQHHGRLDLVLFLGLLSGRLKRTSFAAHTSDVELLDNLHALPNVPNKLSPPALSNASTCS
jgi:hypothetical protein